jgi:hypothetical protein
MRATRVGAIVAAGALVLGLAACGDDDGDVSETGTSPTTATTEAVTTTAGEQPGGPVTELDVTATEYAYDLGGAPTSIPAGLVEVNLTNAGAEEHQATLIRLNDGVDLGQFAAAAGSDPTGVAALQLASGFGGPNAAAPGGGTVSSVQSVVPGNYLMICFIPGPDGQPHAAKGMVTPITDTGDAGPVGAPEGEVAGEIDLAEFAFGIPGDFDGQGTYAVANDGEQTHEAAFYRLDDGATLDDVVAAFADPSGGPPPVTPAGGIAPLGPQRGNDAYVRFDLDPGEYAVLCFLPDSSPGGSGAPHFTLGMATQVTIG